jgi:hypothetical protein
MKWDITAANDKWSAQIRKPLTTGSFKVDGAFLYEQKPAAREWKAEANFFTEFAINTAKFFTNVSQNVMSFFRKRSNSTTREM